MKEIDKLKLQLKNYSKENEIVHKDFAELSERYFLQNQRINKAIEYIEECQLGVDENDRPYMLLNQEEGRELLNILKGETNE